MKYVAMATGGVEFGNDDTALLLKNTDDQDDGDATEGSNEATGFEPGASSTPAPNGNQRQTTMNRPGEQPSFFESPDPPGLSTTTFAESELDKEFPFADKSKLKYKMDAKGRLEVGLLAKKSYYRLLSEIPGEKGKYKINKNLPKEIFKVLGKSRREILEEEIKMLTVEINEDKAMAEDPRLSEAEKNKARERAKRKIEKRADRSRQLDQLINGNYSLPSESIELETFQKKDEVREEIEQEIQSEIKESPSAERAKELQQEQNEIENEREREMEQLPLRDRLREKVKAIFKKYGFTVTAVLLAVGTTFGVLLSSLSNGLKGVANGVSNGFKTLGKKIADILPGLLGAVVSFVFRAAGNVISFLGKHAWLLILAVAAFLFERVMKRRD